LHMDINCGCFATPEPINLKKVLEDFGMAALAVAMTACTYIEARRSHPWAATAKPETA
jgi:hypothetical protein